MIETSRRSLITGLVALVAAPAIVKVASLMPVNAALQPGNDLLTLNQITRGAVRLFMDSNEFLREITEYEPGNGPDRLDVLYGRKQMSGTEINARYQAVFAADGAKIGSQLRVRLPSDYIVNDGPTLYIHHESVPVAFGPLALAVAAVTLAPVMLEKPVTRRFWGKVKA